MDKRFLKIKELRKEYLILSYGKNSLLKVLDEVEVSEHVYNSNAIENSTLTLEETEKILLQIDLDRFLSERELFEAKNLAKVVEFINNKDGLKNLSVDIILFLHKILLSNVRDDIAGRFRKDDEWVRVGKHVAVDPKVVLDKIEKLLIDYNTWIDKNIVEKIALFHLNFESIHPFVDGNGRIGRVLNNYILEKELYVPINIRFLDRESYYQAFKEFHSTGSTKKMENIIFNALLSSYHKRLAYLKGLEIIKLKEYSDKTGVSHSNLINKANRQTIPAFLDKGVWKIGV